MRLPDSLVAKLLRAGKYASTQQLAALRKQEITEKKPLQDLAVSKGLVSEEALARAYAKDLQIPFVAIMPHKIEQATLRLLPERIARKYHAVTFELTKNGTVYIVMENPNDHEAIKFLKKQLGRPIKIHFTSDRLLESALDRYHGETRHSALKISTANKVETSHDIGDTAEAAETVETLISNAIISGALGIHIEPREKFVVIRYRIDGLLRIVAKLPIGSHRALTGHIKTLSNLRLDDYIVPQDGSFKRTAHGKTLILHVSTLPIIDGEKVVIKIHDHPEKVASLKDLGLWGSALHNVQHAIVQPHGMILVTGPVGSGRSTTLFSMISMLNTPQVNIATIENPIRYRIIGANQTQVNPNAGIDYAIGLQVLLQQDASIIMVGEIRESRTAKLVVQAAATGHLVFSSLQLSNAISCMTHLSNMGVEPFLVASSSRLVISQRLVRRLCKTCRQSHTMSKADLKHLEIAFNLKAVGGMSRIQKLELDAHSDGVGTLEPTGLNRLWTAHHRGCDECNHTGYRGRVGLFEVLVVSEKIQSMIAAGKTSAALEEIAINEGMLPLPVDGLIKALRGETTVEEVLRVLGPNKTRRRVTL